jgi:hypothetical protein
MRYGHPGRIRLDAEGAFKGRELEEWASERGVEVEVVPAEDHGQVGIVERLIGVLKQNVKTFLQGHAGDCDVARAVTLMAAAHNEHENVQGFSPLQWAFGRKPSLSGRFFEGAHDDPQHCSEGQAGHPLRTGLQLRMAAEEVFRKSQAARRISQAMNARTTRAERYLPGDLIYFRRLRPPAAPPAHPSFGKEGRTARWSGPGRVLASETRIEHGGLERRAAHVVWIVSHGRLKRCSPWQLRHATISETLTKPESRNPKPETLNPNLSLNPEPETRNHKPATRNPKP